MRCFCTFFASRSGMPLCDTDIKEYLNEFNQTLKQYNGVFNTNYKLPDDVILLPNMDINYNYNYINSFGDDEHLILQINPVALTKLMGINEVASIQIERAFVERGVNNANDYAAWFVYNSMLSSYLKHKGESIPEPSLARMYFQLSLTETSIDPKYIPIYQQLFNVDWQMLSDNFFVEWKENLSDYNKNDWEQLEVLLKHYK